MTITGNIGGRGVSYHDLENTQILTDMYCAINVNEGQTPTVHGEHLIQQVGRLNTIVKPGLDIPPQIRLWAPESTHIFHQTYIKQILSFVESVQQIGNLEEALKAQATYFVSLGKLNPRQPRNARFSRPTISGRNKLGDTGPENGVENIPLPKPSEPKPALKPHEVIALRPDGSFTDMEAYYPRSFGNNDDDEKNRPNFVWREGRSPFDENLHIVFRVIVDKSKVDQNKFEEGFHALGDLKWNRSQGSHSQLKYATLVADFKTRQAAFKFLTSGALGEEEARRWDDLIKRTRMLEVDDLDEYAGT